MEAMRTGFRAGASIASAAGLRNAAGPGRLGDIVEQRADVFSDSRGYRQRRSEYPAGYAGRIRHHVRHHGRGPFRDAEPLAFGRLAIEQGRRRFIAGTVGNAVWIGYRDDNAGVCGNIRCRAAVFRVIFRSLIRVNRVRHRSNTCVAISFQSASI
jgi:hypothetical protein